MTRKDFLEYCFDTYGTEPDYPFNDDLETAVLRHKNNRKWYALVMKVSRRKFGIDSDEVIDVVNLKLPLEMFGSFGVSDGVYPAYHMNKLHWISVLLPDAPNDVIEFLVNASFEATKTIPKKKLVFCPVYKRKIDGTECLVMCDVADRMIKSSVLPNEVKWDEEQGTKCIKCKYHADLK